MDNVLSSNRLGDIGLCPLVVLCQECKQTVHAQGREGGKSNGQNDPA